MKSNILESSRVLSPEIISLRESIHKNPELSFKEFQTQKLFIDLLEKENIPYKIVGGTGIVVDIQGIDPSSQTVIIRGELDALPIQEETSHNYASKNEGIMHACGHDVHSSIVFGVLKMMNQWKDQFRGTLRVIFQPGEEKLPGGASILINEGVLNIPNLKSVIGLHVLPELEVGKFGFKKGKYMASTDEIFVKIVGKGGHGAMPHVCIDPVVLSAEFILQAQQIISRRANIAIGSVLSFGKIYSNGGSTNIIPESVNIEGTFRTYDEKWRSQAHQILKSLAVQLSNTWGADIQLEIKNGYPSLNNDENLTNTITGYVADLFDKQHIIDLEIRPTADDFAYYSQHARSCFFRLGVGNKENGIIYGVHHPKFDIDNESIYYGLSALTYICFNELQ